MKLDEVKEFRDLLSKNEKVNTSLIKKKEFLNHPIYKKIMESSHELDIFSNIKLSERILFLTGQCAIGHCGRCGLAYYDFSRSQNTYKQCNHNVKIKNNLSEIRKNLINTKYKNLVDSVFENSTPIIDDLNFEKMLEQFYSKNDNYAFIPTDENFDFLHDVLVKTKDILKIDIEKIGISQRIYILKNHINELPHCMFCDGDVSFINRKSGYRKVCDNPECVKKLSLLTRKEKIIDEIDSSIDKGKYIILNYPNTLNAENIVIKCRKCGFISEHRINNGRIKNLENMPLCKNCESGVSYAEEEIVHFIKSVYNGRVIHGVGGRTIIPPYELDIFLPDLNIAFEYDGLYYHSKKSEIQPDYHLIKTKLCDSKKIRLIHIFEDEWKFKRKIVESRILNIIGICDKKIFARKCDIKEIPSKESNDFLNLNHLQGESRTSINIGLFYNGDLVSVMTFGKSRFNRNYEYELVRYASKIGFSVIGGAGRLLKYFERTYKPKSIISYADMRWSKGGLYYKLKFDLIHISKPNYYYTNYFQRYSRMRFQKHKLKNILEKFDEKKSERENMEMNGYHRIYDCGNMVFGKTY